MPHLCNADTWLTFQTGDKHNSQTAKTINAETYSALT